MDGSLNQGQLPVEEVIPDLQGYFRTGYRVILKAPPGAGKSTILPLKLLKESWLEQKKIIMLEPRKLAAKAVAARMAFLLGESPGETVGYRVRFENKISVNTRIEVVTEGILTRMIQQDNFLEGVGLVIFDEFHERSLQADLALILTLEVQQVLRPDLRLLLMSATLEEEGLASLLGAQVVESKGRQFFVQKEYIPSEPTQPLAQQIKSAVKKARTASDGDILVFLPGAGEIIKASSILEQEFPDLSVHLLYGDLSPVKQSEAISPDPYGRRKVVLATSIAETSLTIEGVKVVIDSGLSRISRFDPRSGLNRLETIKVTMDSADQRAGRAGRLGPGICYRLWSETQNQYLLPSRKPEILEADLAPLVLELSNWGITDFNSVSWITKPSQGAINQAMKLLNELQAMDGSKITQRGREILKLPTHPRIGHMLLEAKLLGNLALATDVAAIIEEKDPLEKSAGADIMLRVEELRAFRAGKKFDGDRLVLKRIEKLAAAWRKLFNIPEDNQLPRKHDCGLLIALAFPERIAKKKEHQQYRLANGRSVKISETDPLVIENWLAAAQVDAGAGEGRIFLAAALDPSDLQHMQKQIEVITWDKQKGELIARSEIRVGELLMEHKPLKNIDEESKAEVLLEVVKYEGSELFDWSEELVNWQNRVLSLKRWNPEENWPDVSTDYLVNHPEWLRLYISNIRKRDDFKRLDLKPVLSGLLDYNAGQRLAELAPEKLTVPSGSAVSLRYFPDGSPPVLAVRLQEVFGLLDTPTINRGKIKLLLHLLSPGFKPVQVTQDLKSFWQNTYPEVRKELRVRYSKHFWPEDPWTAEAVRGVKRHKSS